MKKSLPLLILMAFALTACSKYSVTKNYDAEICAEMARKVECHDSISQFDYAVMIAQNEAILIYLIDRTKEISELPDSCRYSAWRDLTSQPDYLERFGYMFTIGSALYQADINNRLDKENTDSYNALDDYNSKLADYTDRF